MSVMITTIMKVSHWNPAMSAEVSVMKCQSVSLSQVDPNGLSTVAT